jgi:hypothetical protein
MQGKFVKHNNRLEEVGDRVSFEAFMENTHTLKFFQVIGHVELKINGLEIDRFSKTLVFLTHL